MQETFPSNDRAMRKTRDATAAIGEHAHAGIDRLSAGAHRTLDRVESTAADAADQFDAKREEWSEAAGEWVDATRGYVREHPVASLALALAAGYLLSRVTARL